MKDRTKIIIEDKGKVTLVESVEAIVTPNSIEELFQSLSSSENSSLLPANCISYFQRGVNEGFIIEIKNGIKTVNLQTNPDTREEVIAVSGVNYQLYMPWAYCFVKISNGVINLEEVYITWSAKRIKTMASKAMTLRMPTGSMRSYNSDYVAQSYCAVYNHIDNSENDNIRVNSAVDNTLTNPYSYPGLSGGESFSPKEINELTVRNSKSLTNQDRGYGANSSAAYFRAWEELTKELGHDKMEKIFIKHQEKNGFKYENFYGLCKSCV